MTFIFNLRAVALGIHKDSEAESHNLSFTEQGIGPRSVTLTRT
jgi:hypothetical protein